MPSDPEAAQGMETQAAARSTRLQRLGYRWHRWSWWYTIKLAKPLHRWTQWTQEPGDHWPRWAHRWLAGLNVACWTHLCGHGLRYSFDIGAIWISATAPAVKMTSTTTTTRMA